MNRSIPIAAIIMLAIGCTPDEVPTESAAPAETVEPHNLQYYLDNPEERDAQVEACESVPPQARSKILEGNCAFAQGAFSMKGMNGRK